ncbi:MAG TPA: hypothetical protein VJR47_11755 [Stellaceae bacterium]|nr:hypothetical protein [Stellaceae bacterium]
MKRAITPAPVRKTVRVKVPLARLVLAWQVGGHWRFDPDLITEIELRVTPTEPEPWSSLSIVSSSGSAMLSQ